MSRDIHPAQIWMRSIFKQFGILRGIFGPNQDRTQGGTRMTGLESADQNHIGALECDERAPLQDLKPTIDWSYMSTQWKTLFWAEIWKIRPLSGFVLIQIWSSQPIFWYKLFKGFSSLYLWKFVWNSKSKTTFAFSPALPQFQLFPRRAESDNFAKSHFNYSRSKHNFICVNDKIQDFAS